MSQLRFERPARAAVAVLPLLVLFAASSAFGQAAPAPAQPGGATQPAQPRGTAQPAQPAQPRGAARPARPGPTTSARPSTGRPTNGRPAGVRPVPGAGRQMPPRQVPGGGTARTEPGRAGKPDLPAGRGAGAPGSSTGDAAGGRVGSTTDPGATPPAPEQPPDDDGLYACDKARGRFKVNLAPDVELKDLVTWAFSFTCKNFIYSSNIGTRAAKVTIKSPESMTARQAWSVFLVALQSMGLTVVPKGNVLEIVEYAQARSSPLPIYTNGRPANSDQMVRAILRPEHLPVDEVTQILTEIKSKDGSVRGIPKAGVVVVTDFGSHISKMASLVLAVDTPVMGEKLYMMRVKYADATEMATTLGEILGTKDANAPPGMGGVPGATRGRRVPRQFRGDQPNVEMPQMEGMQPASEVEVASAVPSKILADERTNALILLASEPAYLRVKALVNRLDVSVEVEGAGRIHVYPLENADAEEMSSTLTAVISGIQQPSGGQGGGRQGRAENRAPVEAPRSVANSDSAAFEGLVRVTHDKPTNSLVVVASVKDFLALREVLRKLDVPRPQVYIDATIVEVGIDNSRELGTAWHAGADVRDGDVVVGGVQHSNLSSLNVATLATSTGLIGGALGSILPGAQELLGTSIPSYGILFQALANTSNLDVLSSPHILTTDNEEAEISVGQNIPYQSALVGVPGGAAGGAGFFPTQSIQRQDVELNLKITPQINASDEVKLKIDLTINDIASQDFAGLGPSWSKKTLKDTVVVRDQQAVVLGGLISDKVTHSESKVPLLGDIPILGYLFKFTSKRKEKRNLLIVLTPYIVHNQTDLQRIVEKRVREQREFMRTFSTFREVEYRPETDYRRKRGLVAEVNRLVRDVEIEAKVLQELEQRSVGFPDGPVEYLDESKPEERPPDAEPPGDEEESDDTRGASTEPPAKPAAKPAAPAAKVKKGKKGKASARAGKTPAKR
jgi:general secretion pathway protein D